MSPKRRDIEAELDHVAVGADVDPLSARRRRDTETGDGIEGSDLGKDQALGFGRRDDGAGDRMLGLRFDSRHHGQHCGAVEARCQRHVGQARLALGQGTGLVERDHLDALQGLQGLALAEEHAHLGTTPGADHDRRWRGQTHGAGAGNDEDGDGVDQAEGQGRIRPEDQPDGEGQRRQAP